MGDEILTPGGAQSSGWAQAGVSHFSFPQASLLRPYSSGCGGPPLPHPLQEASQDAQPTGTGPFSMGSAEPTV